MWKDDFLTDGADALRNFEIVGLIHDEGSLYGMIEAQADTGSRYMVYTMPARPVVGSDALVVVRWPWQAVYEITPGSYVTPDYFVQRLGAPHRGSIEHHHGGDVYALLECLRRLIGITYPVPMRGVDD